MVFHEERRSRWVATVRAWKHSGLTQRAFAEREGVALDALRRGCVRLGEAPRSSKRAAAGPHFVEVRTTALLLSREDHQVSVDAANPRPTANSAAVSPLDFHSATRRFQIAGLAMASGSPGRRESGRRGSCSGYHPESRAPAAFHRAVSS